STPSTSSAASKMASSAPSTTFFFQAEDGIRDATVTGVQTCALPISDGYRYSQFCRHYHDWARTLAPTMRQIHRAGEKAFVDFSEIGRASCRERVSKTSDAATLPRSGQPDRDSMA